MKSRYTKKTYIDLLRVISMIAVVLTHIGSTATTDFSEVYLNSTGGVFQSSVANIMHFAVPVFFMISGALLLNENKSITLEKLFGKYIVKYVLVILVFGGFFALLELVFNTRTFSLKYFYQALLNTINGKSWNHMWYMYELLGVMVILPIIKVFVAFADIKTLKYVSLLLFVTESLFPIFGINSSVKIPLKKIYVFYLLMGYMIDSNKLKISNKYAPAVFSVSIIVFVYSAYTRIMLNSPNQIAEYFSPVIVIYSITLFSYFKNTTFNLSDKTSKAVTFLSGVSFGVYILHMFFMNMVFKFFKLSPLSPNAVLGLISVSSIVMVCSILSTCVLKKIPFINKII